MLNSSQAWKTHILTAPEMLENIHILSSKAGKLT